MSTLLLFGCGKSASNESRENNYKDEQTESIKDTDNEEQTDDYMYNTSEIDENGYYIEPSDFMEGEVNIPDEYQGKPVVELSEEAFATHQITEVNLGKNVIQIGEKCFFGCKELSSVKLNEGLKTICESAFLEAGLKGDLVIPDSVERIELCSFGLTQLETIHVGKGVQFVGSQAFAIETLKKVVFESEDIEFEDERVFDECKDLTIVAPKGSSAEKYAKENNINFEEK